MLAQTVLTYIGALGIGGLIGIIIKYLLDKKADKRKMLFDARTKAYTGLMGRILNHFNELDLNTLPEPARISKINQLLSEIYLLGSEDLIDAIGEYKLKLFEFHELLDKSVRLKQNEDSELKEVHAFLAEKAGIIHDLMRRDIYIGKST